MQNSNPTHSEHHQDSQGRCVSTWTDFATPVRISPYSIGVRPVARWPRWHCRLEVTNPVDVDLSRTVGSPHAMNSAAGWHWTTRTGAQA